MERIFIPAREGRGAVVPAGGSFQVVDVEGKQCADLFVFNTSDVNEFASAEHTRVHVGGLFPGIGEHFVTKTRKPILLFEEDRTPGVHDMLVAACDATRYKLLGFDGWHASCQENLEKVMAGFGHANIEIPQPINLFTNIPFGPGGRFEYHPALTRPGDFSQFRVEVESYVVVSSCPQDVVPINDKNPSPLELVVLS